MGRNQAGAMTMGDSAASPASASALAEEGRRVRDFVASNRSETLLRLFDYLLQQSIEGRCPKEAEIAEKIFQVGSSDPGHQGSRVRVGIYRLRKKLDLFYADKPGPQLALPPGEYGFVLRAPETSYGGVAARTAQPPASRPRPGLVPVAIAILLLLNAGAAWFYFSHDRTAGQNLGGSALWQPFVDPENPAIFVIGDYFMFERKRDEHDEGEVIQDLAIENVDDFYEHVARASVSDYIFANDDLYAVSSDILGPISHMSAYLGHAPLHPITASDLDPDMMKASSIIYLGAFDAMSPLLSDPMSEASGFRCGKTCFELIDARSGKRFLSDSPHLLDDRIVPRRDYGYIASFPGPSGKQILILSGTGDAGASQMANVVMDAAMVEQLRQRVGGNLASFEALYQVRTMFNQSYGSTLLIARPIAADHIWDNRGAAH